MKNSFMKLFLLLGLIAGIGNAAIKAASPSQLTIPFDFTVNGKLMKAGNYQILTGIGSSDSRLVLLRSTDGKSSAYISGDLAESASKESRETKLVFSKTGGDYSLAGINSPRVSVKIRKNMQNSAKGGTVEITSAN